MSRKIALPDLHDLHQRHVAGESIQALADEFNVSKQVINRRFREAGLTVYANFLDRFDLDALYARYQSGASSKVLADEIGVDAGTLRKAFKRCGFDIRSLSEARALEMGQLTPEGRLERTEAAHKAVRGSKQSLEFLERRALGVEQAGVIHPEFERPFFEMFHQVSREAFGVAPQKAISKYNVDFAVETVAVELFGGTWHNYGRHAQRFQARVKEILNRGFHLVVIWVEEPLYPLTIEAVNYVIAWAEFARRNPTAIRQYRVIKGNGKLMVAGCAECDHFPFKLSPIRRSQIRCEHLSTGDETAGML